MRNGIGVPQHIVLFGATSEIGQAIVRRTMRPGIGRVTLVARDIDGAARFGEDLGGDDGPDIDVVRYDAADHASAAAVVEECCSRDDIDVAVVAQGVLGHGVDYLGSPEKVADVMSVNATATMSLLCALAARMKRQGSGRIVLLSSVAGLRVRKGNPVYGASKAAVDGFALALDHELAGSGVSILVVRPGFVVSRMTAGMPKPPFSATPDSVAEAVDRSLNTRASVVHVPSLLRWVFGIFRVLPQAVWRRLPLD